MIMVIVKYGVASFFSTLAFAVLFNIKRDKLIAAGIAGAVGGILYKICIYYGMNEYLANFIGALGLSICSEIFARVYKTPVTTFLCSALIPLVPGGYLFTTIRLAIRQKIDLALYSGFTVIAISMILATAILIVAFVFRTYSKYKRKTIKA